MTFAKKRKKKNKKIYESEKVKNLITNALSAEENFQCFEIIKIFLLSW